MNVQYYTTPDDFDRLCLFAHRDALCAVLFAGTQACRTYLCGAREAPSPVLTQTARWLDGYFAGKPPEYLPPMHLRGLTPFRERVLRAVQTIPYGKSATYGQLAAVLARETAHKMCAQAVGGALGYNPVCILIPCHRVLGAGGKLTGYGGGIQNKIALLRLEGQTFLLPK